MNKIKIGSGLRSSQQKSSLVVTFSCSLLLSCSGGGGGGGGSEPVADGESDGIASQIVTEDNGVVTGRITVDNDVPNIIYASADSSISGTYAEFPQGTFNVVDGAEVTVTLEAGAPLPSDSLQSELGLGEGVGVIADAPPSLIDSTVGDLNGPMILNVLLPTTTNLQFCILKQVGERVASLISSWISSSVMR